jgi:hypothetical protein
MLHLVWFASPFLRFKLGLHGGIVGLFCVTTSAET